MILREVEEQEVRQHLDALTELVATTVAGKYTELDVHPQIVQDAIYAMRYLSDLLL